MDRFGGVKLLKTIYKMAKRTWLWMRKVCFIKSTFKLPLFLKIKMKMLGFIPDQYVRFDLKNNDYHEYITEFERWKSREINGRYNLVLDDKILFEEVFHKYVPVPCNLCWIYKEVINDLVGMNITESQLIDLLKNKTQLIAKPVIQGGSGKGVHVLEYSDGKFYFDNQEYSKPQFLELVKKLDDYILVEYVKQHKYSNDIFSKAVNTIRIITIYNAKEGRAEITHVIHRIGVKASIPVDNAMKGALIAKINDDNTMCAARTLFDTKLYSTHPDTGAQIEGVKVPYLDSVKPQLIEVAEKFPYIPFMAWDIVITDDEKHYSVIEINTSSGLNFVQLWKGERNTKLGQFYKEHGIFK